MLTSDHGEMFERGNIGHETPISYEAGIRIPLLIFPPGQQRRMDIHAPTSAVDILPTLLQVAGQPAVEWSEGVVLPPISNQAYPSSRSLYSFFHLNRARKSRPISQGSAVIVKENLKLLYTFGIPELGEKDPLIELYDLAADPEELENLYQPTHPVAKHMLEEVRTQIAAADAPYR